MEFNHNYLDTDNDLIGKSLRFVNNDLEKSFNEYFSGSGANGGNYNAPLRDYQIVQPKPGFCIKTYKVNTNEKYFINICQAAEIPPPEDISEAKLTEILQSVEPSSFRIPMSISEPRITKDKSNNPVDAVDIAVNPKFFTKIEKSLLFCDFFLALIGEAINDKYNIQIKIHEAIILNNRKFIGNLVSHRVRNKDVKTVLNTYESSSGKELSNKTLVQEINEKELSNLKRKAEEIKLKSQQLKLPMHKLRARVQDDCIEEIQAEFFLPKCISSQEITLDIGGDRILLESKKHGYLFDKFVNYNLKQDRVHAIFDKTNKILQVRIPVIPAK